ncbi:MAG: hypothetical protein CVV33_03090 [Methanomicrobiales archaeon HGW-Methanomicrobiales-4]|nr:MAG: hypothetical protein CVV33_03090 [Methanomicrobiales archaeon HGW-Methanomicrobiales-4]
MKISLKAKIFLALLIPLIITLIILSTAGTTLINTGVSDVARDHQKSLSYLISNRLSDALVHYPGYLISVFSDTREFSDSAQLQQNIYQMNRTGMDLIFDQGVGVYSVSGNLLAHTPVPDGRWENLPPDQVRTLIKERKAQFSSLNTNIKIPSISVYAPVIRENNGVIAILEGRISPEYSLFGSRLIDVLEIQSGSAGYALLLDSKGNILYQRFQGDIYEEIGPELISVFKRTDILDTPSAVFLNNLTGREQYAGDHNVAGTDWWVVAHEDRKVILNDLDQYLALTYLLIIGVFIISVLLIFLLINHLLFPLHALLNGVKQVREGKLEPYPFPRYRDEFGILTTEFNRMISALMLSFAELDTSRRRYQSILNQAYDGFMIINAQTLMIEESNRMAHTITGYSRSELKDMSILSLIMARDIPVFRSLIETLKKEGMNGEFEGKIVCSDQKKIITEINIIRIRIDKADYFQTTIRDVSERRRAEEGLRESEERLRILLEKAPEAILIYNVDKAVISGVNESAERLFGEKRENIIGLPIEKYDTHDGTKISLSDACRKYGDADTTDDEVIIEMEIVTRTTGEIHTCEVRFTRIPYRGVRLVRMSFIDITERKITDEKIRKGVQMLALNQETLAILNDQIRNPLTVIALVADGIDPEKEAQIMHEITRIDDIITQLDKGWLESDKVRKIMKRHYDMSDEELR